MLDATRIRSGHLSLHKENFDMVSLAEETIDRMRPLFLAVNNQLIFDRPQESIMLHGDKMRIEQVIVNLLSNGLRYGEGRPVTLKIERKNEKILLSVKDQGIGIDKKNQEKVFNRFERGSVESSVAGIGLGLFIVRELVRLHGGRIWIESEINKGATFFIEL